MTNTAPGWEGLIADDERILWQGRPGTRVIWRDMAQAQSRIGLFVLFIATAFLWASAEMLPDPTAGWAQAGVVIMVWTSGAVVWFGALYQSFGRLFVDAWTRRGTWYTLTDRAAFVATDAFGRKRLRRYGTDDMRGFALDRGPRGNVWFARETFTYTTRTSRGQNRRVQTEYQPVGFRCIDDAEMVYELMAPHRKAVMG